MDENYLQKLPTEITKIIALFLDDRSRRMLRSASIQWFNIINYDEFTIYFARPSTLPDLVNTFSRYSKPIGLRFEKIIDVDASITILASLTQLTKLVVESSKISQFYDLHPFTTLTKLQHFTFGRCNIMPYLQHFRNLTKLDIPTDYNYQNTRYLDELQHLTKLEEFSYNLPIGFKDELNVISKFGNYSSLKTLEFYDDDGGLVFDEESVAKMSNVSKVSITCRDVLFPFSKLPNLESLNMESDRFDDFSLCTKLTSLTIQARRSKKTKPKISAFNHDYQQLTALTKLKDINLRLTIGEDQLDFLSKMTDLESLTVSEKDSNTWTGQFLEFVKSSKLTKISFARLNKLEYLEHLTSLEMIAFDSVEFNENCSIVLPNVTCLSAPDILTAPVFPNLKKLSVFDNHTLEKISFERLSGLTLLSKLESLTLPAISKEILPLIAMHTKLTKLQAWFDSNENYDFEVLDRLTNLKVLLAKSDHRFNTSKSKPMWRAISKMTNLEELDMFSISESSVAVLKSLPKLTELYVASKSAAKFDETNLSCLTNLQVLRLTSGYLFNHKSPHICKLKLLYLYDCSD